jgi:sulfur-carrier protein
MHTYSILFFGASKEISKSSKISLDSNASDLNGLKAELYAKFNSLEGSVNAIAVNQQIVQENVPLKNGDEIAFMPPFSGG